MLIRTYPELARELVKMISSATREIYIAPRYYEPAIGSRLLAKFAEGVSIHVLDSNACGVRFEERIRVALTHDAKNRELMQKLLDSPGTIVKTEDLPYSFAVVDGKYCGVELTNPNNPDNFSLALKLESSELAKELIGMFESLAGSTIPKKIEVIENVGQ